ncbi:hypothetical protein [Ramlibacter sp.]|uniref:hypothetical protein n=1 Tax=Ramlibacter sp. TaxID=1917967 RepID=UPI0026320FB1|nr:hypothetical protein [Ramlibacter sp.]
MRRLHLEASEPEDAAITEPSAAGRLWDARRLLHGAAPQPSTFRLHGRRCRSEPLACDSCSSATA